VYSAIKANLTNVADKLYGESLYRGHYIPGAGRQFQVSLTAKF
jgi:catecholate siderophore receptor